MALLRKHPVARTIPPTPIATRVSNLVALLLPLSLAALILALGFAPTTVLHSALKSALLTLAFLHIPVAQLPPVPLPATLGACIAAAISSTIIPSPQPLTPIATLLPPNCLLSALLATLSVHDLRSRTGPHLFTLGGTALLLALSSLNSLASLPNALAGLSTGYGCGWALATIGGLFFGTRHFKFEPTENPQFTLDPKKNTLTFNNKEYPLIHLFNHGGTKAELHFTQPQTGILHIERHAKSPDTPLTVTLNGQRLKDTPIRGTLTCARIRRTTFGPADIATLGLIGTHFGPAIFLSALPLAAVFSLLLLGICSPLRNTPLIPFLPALSLGTVLSAAILPTTP